MTSFAKLQGFTTNRPETTTQEIALKCSKLPKKNEKRPRTIVITQSENPVVICHDGKIIEIPVEPIPEEEMVDINGAGDAFVGGFLALYIQEKPLKICAKCGIYAASQIIRRRGCSFEGKFNFDDQLWLFI